MTKKEDIIIMNFSGIYRQQQFWRTGEIQRQNISWVEVQELTGSNCYCDEEAAKVLKEKLKKFSAEGMHFIDSGNYHYMSRIWLEKLETPFRLVVFDNHTDIQLPAYAAALDAGGWLLMSGILEADVAPLSEAARAAGFSVTGHALRNGWARVDAVKN